MGVIVAIASTQFLFAQTTEGVINYEVKVNMHRRLAADQQAMKEMTPEFMVHQDILFFRAHESLYKTIQAEESEEDDESQEGRRMVIRRPNVEIYTNRENFKRIKLQEFIGKKFLITDTLKILPWKFGTEQKEILGYPCKQASYYNEERKQQITAWYTDKLLPFLGPEGLNSLPGTILQLDFDNGDRTVTATKIIARALQLNEIKIPSGGQVTTNAEFRKIVDDQMKRRGNGNIIIRN